MPRLLKKVLLTVRGGDDWVEVSQKEEPSDERVDHLRGCLGELLLDKGSCGLAEPADPKGDLLDRGLQPLEDGQHKVL